MCAVSTCPGVALLLTTCGSLLPSGIRLACSCSASLTHNPRGLQHPELARPPTRATMHPPRQGASPPSTLFHAPPRQPSPRSARGPGAERSGRPVRPLSASSHHAAEQQYSQHGSQHYAHVAVPRPEHAFRAPLRPTSAVFRELEAMAGDLITTSTLPRRAIMDPPHAGWAGSGRPAVLRRSTSLGTVPSRLRRTSILSVTYSSSSSESSEEDEGGGRGARMIVAAVGQGGAPHTPMEETDERLVSHQPPTMSTTPDDESKSALHNRHVSKPRRLLVAAFDPPTPPSEV